MTSTHQQRAYIESLGVYLPERSATSSDVVDGCLRCKRIPLERLTGIRERRVVGENEGSIDLAIKATDRCLARSSIHSQDIDLVICCNISKTDGSDYLVKLEPSTAIQLIHHFGFSRAHGFDVANACAGMFTGMHIAQHFLQREGCCNVLVVSGEYISHLSDTAQKEIENIFDPRLACLTLGDAGAAVLLAKSREKNVGFHYLNLATLGKHHPYCVAHPTDQPHGGSIMCTQAKALADVGLKETINYFIQSFDQENFPWEKIRQTILHQISSRSIKSGMKLLNNALGKVVLHEENVVDNLRYRGNTASTSHMVALHDSLMKREIKAGDKALFGITASGLTVGVATYQFDDLPDRMLKNGAASARRRQPRRAKNQGLQAPNVRILETTFLDHAVAQQLDNSTDMAIRAAHGCLDLSAIRREDVALLLYTGVHRSKFLCEPAIAAIVAGELGLNHISVCDNSTQTLAYDVINGALGTLNALHIASQPTVYGGSHYTLITSSEDPHCEDEHSPFSNIAKAGSAMLLGSSGSSGEGFCNFVFTNHCQSIHLLQAGCRQHGGESYLDGRVDPSFNRAMLEAIKENIKVQLEQTGLSLKDFKTVLLPQLGQDFVSTLATELGVEEQAAISTELQNQNLYTSSLAYSFQKVKTSGNVRQGELGLIVAVGSGVQVGSAVYRF